MDDEDLKITVELERRTDGSLALSSIGGESFLVDEIEALGEGDLAAGLSRLVGEYIGADPVEDLIEELP